MDSRKLFVSLGFAAVIVGVAIWLLLSGGSDQPGTSSRGEDELSRRVDESIGGPADAAKSGTAEAEDAVAGKADETDAPKEPVPEVDNRPVSLEGVVSTREKRPIEGARVIALLRSAWEEEFDKQQSKFESDPMSGLRNLRTSLEAAAEALPSAETDEEGRYRFRGLDEGDHRVFVAHRDFLPFKKEVWIEITEGRKSEFNVELDPGLRVAGLVLDPEGKPLPDVSVSALPTDVARLRGIGKMVQALLHQVGGTMLVGHDGNVTDENGRFEVVSLEPRLHDLKFELDGYAWREVKDVPPGSDQIIVRMTAATKVTGRVLSPKGEPVEGASVSLQQSLKKFRGEEMAMLMADIDVLGERTREAKADPEGRFELHAFRKGSYEIVVKSDDFPRFTQDVRVSSKPVNIGDLTLQEGQEISGQVVDSNGAPIVGVAVTAKKVDEEQRRRRGPIGVPPEVAKSESDDRGRFSFSKLGDGQYDVSATADGMSEAFLGKVEPGSNDLQLVLSPGLTASGVVVALESGEPVAGATVKVNGRPKDGVLTDENGRFEVHGVSGRQRDEPNQPVHFTFEARAPGFQRSWNGKQKNELEGVLIELRPIARLNGVVVDQDGEPVGGARVFVDVAGIPRAMMQFDPEDQELESTTDDEGEFELDIPNMGRRGGIEVVAKYPGYAPSRSKSLKVDWNATSVPPIEIVLTKGSSITGVVRDVDGQAVKGALVRARRNVKLVGEAVIFSRLMPPMTGDVAYAAVDGSFTLNRIAPGTYRVEAEAVGYAKKTLLAVEVGDEPVEVDLELDPGESLAGRVVDVDGRGMQGVEVVANWIADEELLGDESDPREQFEREIFQKFGSVGSARVKTDAEGRFEMKRLPRGSFRVVARADGYEPAQSEPVEPGEPVEDLVLAPLCRIVGRVVDAQTGAPVEKFTIRLDRKYPGRYREEYQFHERVDNPEGRFVIDRVFSGEVRVRASSDTFVESRKEIRLEPGAEVTIELALDVGSTIDGVVRHAITNEPIEGANVNSYPIDDQGNNTWQDRRRATSDENGRFVIEGLADGSHRLDVHHPLFYWDISGEQPTFEAPFEEAPSFTLKMLPAGRVRGRVANLPDHNRDEVRYHLELHPIEAEGQEGEPAPNIGRGPQHVWLNNSNRFDGSSLPPGRYRVVLKSRLTKPIEPGQSVETVNQTERTVGEVDVEGGSTTELPIDAAE